MKRYYFLLFILLTNFITSGQQLNGIWRGKLTQGPGGCFKEYNIEFQIQVNNAKVSGVSYQYFFFRVIAAGKFFFYIIKNIRIMIRKY